jgi:hypothetical protein
LLPTGALVACLDTGVLAGGAGLCAAEAPGLACTGFDFTGAGFLVAGLEAAVLEAEGLDFLVAIKKTVSA